MWTSTLAKPVSIEDMNKAIAARSGVLPLWRQPRLRGRAGRLDREDFNVDARLLRRGLLDNGYSELPIGSQHAVEVEGLPAIHKDPFDRMLIAQAMVEGITLLTSDAIVAQYPGPIRKI